MDAHRDTAPIRFGPFEANPRTRELTKHGRRVRLPGLPFELLLALLERPGELVSREDLRKRLWSEDTFVDFDNNLNAAVTRLRQALGDSAEQPRYIETLPRLGYRFVGSIETPATATEPAAAPRPRRYAGPLAIAAAILLVLVFAGWRTLRPRDVPPARQMLVVLPFDNLSDDPAQDYVSDGFTEEIITELARLDSRRLGVIARTTAFKYKGARRSVREIGEDLNASLVVEGSVRRDGDRVRVTAQLIRTDDQSHIWANTYDRPVRDLLSIEREIGLAIAAAIHVAVIPHGGESAVADVREEARDAYLRARYFAAEATVASMEKAIAHYREAIEAEPGYALAHAGLARALVFGTRTAPKAALQQARDAATRARELSPTLRPEAELAWAIAVLYGQRDLEAAGEAFRRVLHLDPGNAEAHFYHAQYLTAAGRFDEALSAARQALELDPSSTLVHHYIGRILHFAGRRPEAVAHLQRTLDLDPEYGWALLFLAVAHEPMGEFDKATAARQKYWTAMGVPQAQVDALGETFRKDGYRGVRRAWIAWIEGFARESGYVTSTELAMLYGALGEKDQAFAWLQKAVENDTRDLIYLRVYPELDPLRSDARFAQVLSQVFTTSR
jgi:TolB-like protein/DNA-binding winged helix-turn-helix (wHTH) protein/Flp pilus assembly protein TadD